MEKPPRRRRDPNAVEARPPIEEAAETKMASPIVPILWILGPLLLLAVYAACE